jgi:hypothetical protein
MDKNDFIGLVAGIVLITVMFLIRPSIKQPAVPCTPTPQGMQAFTINVPPMLAANGLSPPKPLAPFGGASLLSYTVTPFPEYGEPSHPQGAFRF